MIGFCIISSTTLHCTLQGRNGGKVMNSPVRQVPVSVTGIHVISEVSVKTNLILFHNSRKKIKPFSFLSILWQKPIFCLLFKLFYCRQIKWFSFFLFRTVADRQLCNVLYSQLKLIPNEHRLRMLQTLKSLHRLKTVSIVFPFFCMKIKLHVCRPKGNVFFEFKIMPCYLDKSFV